VQRLDQEAGVKTGGAAGGAAAIVENPFSLHGLSMRVLNAAETAAALPYAQLVPAIGQAVRELAAGKINAPERLVVTTDARSVLLCMPALGSDLGVTKLITVHNDNARHGLPAIQGEVTVFDVATGRRLNARTPTW
jgi:1-piperideine-2-carboxylate/1-pyrroline-2-carboxylate reductase [NAD(P)H]